MPTITITTAKGSADYQLDPPRVSHALDIAGASRARYSWGRVCAASIALASDKVRRKLGVGTLEQAGCDVADFGGRVLDALVAQGVSIEQVTEIGKVCIAHLLSGLPSEQEVKEAQGNSNATP